MVKIIKGISGKVDFNNDWIINTIDFPMPPDLFLDEEYLRSYVENNIKHVSPFNQAIIQDWSLFYNYTQMSPYSLYYTIIEVNIPYVLHVPNYSEINITHPKKSKIILQKIWTWKAIESDNFEAVSDIILYYRDWYSISPRIPHDALEDWKWNIPESKNIEEIYPTWSLRYTKMQIHFENDFTIDEAKWIDFDTKYLPKLYSDTLDIVNKFLSVYRNCMQAYSINLLDHAEVMNIYFPKFGFWYYPIHLNFWSAIINREKQKIESYIKQLEEDNSIPLYDISIDNAKSALLVHDYKSVVIESFLATDLFIESYILTKLSNLWKTLLDIGVNEAEYKYWSTKLGLREGYKVIHWKTFKAEEKDLCELWEKKYKDIRNKTIHNGHLPTEEEAQKVLEINDTLILKIKSR